MRLLFTIIFALAIAAFFERKRIQQFLAARRSATVTSPPPGPQGDATEAQRQASWRSTVNAVDQRALREALTILADGQSDRVTKAFAAAEACWQTTRWQDVPAKEADRTELWWNRAMDSLEEDESVIGFDWKDYSEFTQGQLIHGLPLPKEVANTPPPEGKPIEEKLRHFDAALQPFGYRFILITSPYDDLRGKVVSKSVIPRLLELSDILRVDTGGPPPERSSASASL